ncbi:hypothetical protein H5410_051273 [Solanum commersonii]|uniref:Uncharacterized protein n=1 Tax=Solanum commersonii TaxID=4109 RepID=A0A9J5X093_SOLCO|nr:hypothetical protein H5410_051273 [Solanum commersonii]
MCGKRTRIHSVELNPFRFNTIEDPLTKLVQIADPLGDPPFGLGSAHWNIRRGCRPVGDSPNGLGDHQAVFSSYFQPLCSFLLDSIHVFKLEFSCLKRVSQAVLHQSIMNAHNKTHFTHAKINCALKDSSCDSPLSKNLMFTILA